MAEERAQRRLAAILAADVVGYSRLMGADEDDPWLAGFLTGMHLDVLDHRADNVHSLGAHCLVDQEGL